MKAMALALVLGSVARAEGDAEEEAAYVALQVRCFPSLQTLPASSAEEERGRQRRCPLPPSSSHTHTARAQPDGDVLFFENFDDEAAFEKVWSVSSSSDFPGASLSLRAAGSLCACARV